MLKPWTVALLMAACVAYFLYERAGQQMIASRGPVPDAPVQQSTRAPAIDHAGYTIEPVADYAVRARVLSIERYRLGREADLSPVDFVLGWGPMSDDAVIERLTISQANRWYMYRWQDAPPIDSAAIVATSANTHLVPANPHVEDRLLGVRKGAVIRLTGHLVNVRHADGWRWNSSLSRTDTGNGSCELMFVTDVQIE